MNDNLLYNLNVLGIVDTTLVSDTISTDTIIVTEVVKFLQTETMHLAPIAQKFHPDTDIITYILLVLLGVIAVIWHFMNDRFSTMFSLKTDSLFNRLDERNAVVPGTIITSFFWFNFIISTGFFCYLIVRTYFSEYVSQFAFFELMAYIYLIICSVLIYRIIVIYGTSLVFETQSLMHQQVITGRNIQFITGVILTPILILILHVNSSFVIFFTLGVIILLQTARILKIMIIGKSSTIFSVLHIILYLCALEIVPVLVLIRMIGNASVM